MEPNTRAAIAAAVDALIEDSDAVTLYAALEGVLALSKRDIPVALTGRPSVLNPLIDLARSNPVAYEKVFELIERKREERDLPPLVPDGETRRVYMREFMAIKRDRQRRLVELWNGLRSEHDKIRGTNRLEFERIHAARWMDEKNRREAAARGSLGRRLTSEERRSIADALWSDVDEELARLEQFVRDEMRKPVPLRSREGFKFTVGKL